MMKQNYFGILPPPDLPDYIHPIFAYSSRWKIQRREHDRVNLGLRLASQLLSSPPVLHYFAKALFGDFATDAQGRDYLRDVTLTKPLLNATQKILEETAPYIEFGAEDLGGYFEGPYADTIGHYPRTRLVPEEKRCYRYADVHGMPVFITFNTQGLNDFEPIDNADVDLRMQFQFASSALHELAHAIYFLTQLPVEKKPSPPPQSSEDKNENEEPQDKYPKVGIAPPEPRFHQHTLLRKNEYGFELELALFDRIIQSAGFTFLPRWGLWAEAVTGSRRAETKRQLVPMAWVTWWFRMDSLRQYQTIGKAAMPPMTDFWYSLRDAGLDIVPS
jgi:hypothetical protein